MQGSKNKVSGLSCSQAQGMQTLDQCLQELVMKGMVSREEARFRAVNKEAF